MSGAVTNALCTAMKYDTALLCNSHMTIDPITAYFYQFFSLWVVIIIYSTATRAQLSKEGPRGNFVLYTVGPAENDMQKTAKQCAFVKLRKQTGCTLCRLCQVSSQTHK